MACDSASAGGIMSTIPVSEKICSLSKIDLNLLTLFCLIYSVGSISKVADMLDISPLPSASRCENCAK
jgi:hypothetical protein